MPSQAFRLIYPKKMVSEPVINNLLRQYNFTLNIIRASITEEEGWMDIQMVGKALEIEDAVTWLKGQGIDVLLIPK